MVRVVVPVDQIVAAYQAGIGTTALAERWGTSPATIAARLRGAGVTLRRRGAPSLADRRAEVVRLRDDERMIWADIAHQLDISDHTARRWYRLAGGTGSGQVDPAREIRTADELPAGDPIANRSGWSMGERQHQLEGWRPGRRPAGPDQAWCTQTEAAQILGVSRGQVWRLIYEVGALQPWYAPGGRLLLQRGDVHTAARLAGPNGAKNRWDAARAAVGSPQPPPLPHRPRRDTARAQQVNKLPWPQIADDYEAGTTTRDLTQRYVACGCAATNQPRSCRSTTPN